MDTDQDRLIVEDVGSEPAPEGPLNRSEVGDTMEDAISQLTNRLDAHVTQTTEESLIGIAENLDDDHNMEFERGLLRRATCLMLTSAKKDKGV